MSSISPTPELQMSQLQLRLQYRELVRHSAPLPAFSETEFRAYSQNGEDGILRYLFSLLGTLNRKVVEICAGDGTECNAANLVINHAWQGLLFDGDRALIEHGRQAYAQCRNTWVAPPTLVHAWITAENIDALVAAAGFTGDIDLLSLDLDGNDYWIWRALTCVAPRVVVLEFNAAAGPDERLTIEYDPAFRLELSSRPYRCGASLPAFCSLAASKGYRLVGVQSLGFNAFFVRDDLGREVLPTRTPREIFETTDRLKARWKPALLAELLAGDQKWVTL